MSNERLSATEVTTEVTEVATKFIDYVTSDKSKDGAGAHHIYLLYLAKGDVKLAMAALELVERVVAQIRDSRGNA